MKKTFKPILSVSLVAAFALGLSACSFDKDSPNLSPSANSSQSSSASPSSSSSASPSSSSSQSATPTSPSEDKSTEDAPEIVSERELAKGAYPEVEGDERATAEEIQLALLGAERYVNGIYNSGYLANGTWNKNGADSYELVEQFGNGWSDTYRGKIENLTDDHQNGNEEVKETAARDLMLHFFYFSESEAVQISEECISDSIAAPSCLLDDRLEFGEAVSFITGPNGKIFVNMKFTANVKFDKDEVQGVSPVQYDIQLEMVKNPHPDENNMRFAYVVNDLGGKWSIDEWQERE